MGRSLFRLRCEGRGTGYSPVRGLVESALRLAYVRDWPARAWAFTGRAAQVELVEHELSFGRVSRPPLRVAFASDLHLGPTTSPSTLDRAFALLAAAAPDVLVLGGDYVFLDATEARMRELGDRIASVPARTKIAVLGNHDLWADDERIASTLVGAGVSLLVNDAVRLPAPHDDVAFVGLDEPWTGRPDVGAALAKAHGASLLLGVCHSPDGVPYVRDTPVRLLLAGHTHGGQIALPGPTPLYVPGPLGKRWPYGLHALGDLHLFVSRGVGSTEVPMRTFAPPDVAVLTVR